MAIFELRTYDIQPGKLSAIKARFRDHTMRIFKKHGIEVVDFWEREEGEAGQPAQLIYVCTFPDEARMQQAWTGFRADPEWQAARTKSEENGPLTIKVTSVTMRRSDFSPAT